MNKKSVHRSGSHLSKHVPEEDVSFNPGSTHYIKGIPETSTNIKAFRSSVDINPPSLCNSKRLSMPSLREMYTFHITRYKVSPDNLR